VERLSTPHAQTFHSPTGFLGEQFMELPDFPKHVLLGTAVHHYLALYSCVEVETIISALPAAIC